MVNAQNPEAPEPVKKSHIRDAMKRQGLIAQTANTSQVQRPEPANHSQIIPRPRLPLSTDRAARIGDSATRLRSNSRPRSGRGATAPKGSQSAGSRRAHTFHGGTGGQTPPIAQA